MTTIIGDDFIPTETQTLKKHNNIIYLIAKALFFQKERPN
jgi:hypothetical protein